MEQTGWLQDVKRDAPQFLESMRGNRVHGFFRYSFSGDLFDESVHWGLGNTVFAVKCLFTLGLLDSLSVDDRRAMVGFIESFKRPDGSIFDPLIARRAFWREKLAAIKHHDFNNFFHAQTVRAETRQAMSALALLGRKGFLYPADLPRTTKDVVRFLSSLNWTRPWSAGSHFSHLLFFLSHCQVERRDELLDTAIAWVSSKQRNDGSWYDGEPSLQQKINGAMKVLTGLQAAGRLTFDRAENLIDLALIAQNDLHACDNFNVVYVLAKASVALNHVYRFDEIQSFAMHRLQIYQSHYWPEHGGFSYFPRQANTTYYHARISRGLPEPDIHGTVLFLWGLALIGQLLRDERFSFNEFVT